MLTNGRTQNAGRISFDRSGNKMLREAMFFPNNAPTSYCEIKIIPVRNAWGFKNIIQWKYNCLTTPMEKSKQALQAHRKHPSEARRPSRGLGLLRGNGVRPTFIR